MSLAYFDGRNLSGRSDALKAAVWTDGGRHPYIHPSTTPSLSGLATTVGGELYLHGIHPRQRGGGYGLPVGLPLAQSLTSLSGGQQARLAVACALGGRPERLAIDGVLAQLDPANRAEVLEHLAICLTEVFIADDQGDDIMARGGRSRRFERPESAPDLNGALAALSAAVIRSGVDAPVLEFDKLSFAYRRGPRIFDRTSVRLAPGRIHLLKAPNGSGKSTLARLLVGVQRPTQGRLLTDSHAFDPAGSGANLLFYGFQNPFDQIHGSSPRRYLTGLGARASRRPVQGPDPGALRPEDVLTLGGLQAFAEMELFELPPFVAKRLSILAALVSRSPWLFFDEPAYGSDTEGRMGLRLLFERLAAAGRGLIVVSHGTEFDDSPLACKLSIEGTKLIGGGGP